MRTVACFSDPASAAHTIEGHPEHAGRLQAIIDLLQAEGLWERLNHLPLQPATEEQLLAVHEPRYLDFIARLVQTLDEPSLIGGDTYITRQSYDLARSAAGGACALVDAIMGGQAERGLALLRPPGHHATPKMAMGFCLLSNIAIAARHAIKGHGLERVAIIDYDVHHGNGTQDALYDDPQILFISSHQSPLYPGTGHLNEIGAGVGKGATVNIPLPSGVGDAAFEQVYTEVVAPIVKRFNPQLILVSVGIDAHWVDPLAGLNLSLKGYDVLARLMIALSDELCGGRIGFIMEGGYDLTALSHAWLNITRALLGEDKLSDPLGMASKAAKLPQDLLARLQSLHQLV